MGGEGRCCFPLLLQCRSRSCKSNRRILSSAGSRVASLFLASAFLATRDADAFSQSRRDPFPLPFVTPFDSTTSAHRTLLRPTHLSSRNPTAGKSEPLRPTPAFLSFPSTQLIHGGPSTRPSSTPRRVDRPMEHRAPRVLLRLPQPRRQHGPAGDFVLGSSVRPPAAWSF